MKRRRWLWIVAACSFFAGCYEDRGYQLAAVSGVVTLDGKPLANARVTFHPIRKSADTSGVGGTDSYGITDSSGRFSLRAVLDDREGATVGENSVSISTLKVEEGTGDDAGSQPVGERTSKIVQEEQVPEKYNLSTTLRFTVPSEGSDSANFDLTSG
jgi:hypothetical protein